MAEDLSVFFSDPLLTVSVAIGLKTTTGIFDNADQDLSGGIVETARYKLLLRTSDFPFLVSISIVSSALTCVATAVSHGLRPGKVVFISGFTDTHKNGSFIVLTVPTANTFTFLGPAGTTNESPALGAGRFGISDPVSGYPITVDGLTYTVNSSLKIDDGKLLQLDLSKV